MKIQDSIRLCLRDFNEREYESAMLHACTAIDGIATKKEFGEASKSRFLRFIRSNYDVIEPIAFPQSYIKECLFPIPDALSKETKGKEDLANLIYTIHRCPHCHGSEVPSGFQLISDELGESEYIKISYNSDGSVRISTRIIPALVMAVVLQKYNWESTSIKALNKYSVFCEYTGIMPINEWWGRKNDFIKQLERKGYPRDYDRIAVRYSKGKSGKIDSITIKHANEFMHD